MYRLMSNALRRVRSVRTHAVIRANRGGATTITIGAQVPGRAQVTIVHGSEVVNERYLGDDVYFRYSASALLALTGNVFIARAEAQRWIELPDSDVPLASSMRHMVSHDLMEECDVLGPSGKLSVGGPTTVNGLPAIALRDHGGRPGTARRQILVSANAPYLPLEIIQKRPARSGGNAINRCFSGHARSTVRRFIAIAQAFDRAHHLKLRSYNQTIDSYNNPLYLTRPPHPLTPASTSSADNAVSV
jgi:hypothetical protein